MTEPVQGPLTDRVVRNHVRAYALESLDADRLAAFARTGVGLLGDLAAGLAVKRPILGELAVTAVRCLDKAIDYEIAGAIWSVRLKRLVTPLLERRDTP